MFELAKRHRFSECRRLRLLVGQYDPGLRRAPGRTDRFVVCRPSPRVFRVRIRRDGCCRVCGSCATISAAGCAAM